MKSTFVLIAAITLILVSDGLASAGSQCAKRCDNWCAKNFAMKNSAACSQQCQIKHCR